MGHGRQKAKQTKVARKLKYFSPDTDLRQLERELASGSGTVTDDEYDVPSTDDDGDDDEYWEPRGSYR